MNTAIENTIANEPKYHGFDYMLAFSHDQKYMPTVRHTPTPDSAIEMARKVVAQYPDATWYVVRRSDGVCIAQAKQDGDIVQQEANKPVKQEQASTALVLPGCVTSLMLRSKSEVQPDGTVAFKFTGKVRSRPDLHAFYVIAEERNWGRTYVRYAGSGEGFDWTLYQDLNNNLETTSKVRFEMRDYSKQGTNDLEQRIARLVLRNQGATPAKIAKLVMAEIAK